MATRDRSRKTQFATIKPTIYFPKRQFLITCIFIPIFMYFLTLLSLIVFYLAPKAGDFSIVKPDVSQWETTFHNDVGFATVYFIPSSEYNAYLIILIFFFAFFCAFLHWGLFC